MFFRIIILTFISTTSIIAVSGQETKISADSLFANQKFTEAFELYDAMYQSGETSQAMLLKMAYIKEGLGDYTNSLIYLDKYYELTSNRKAFDKMSELADENNLTGYAYSDNRLFSALLKNARQKIILVLILLLIGSVVTFFYKKRKGSVSISSLSIQVVVSLALVIITNGFFQNDEGIIKKNQTIVMSGPSAGAEPLLVLEKGHKVEILEKENLWFKIKWDENEAWVRSQQMQVL